MSLSKTAKKGTNTSRNREVALRFTDILIFELDGVIGYNIQPFSVFKSEQEILLHLPIIVKVISYRVNEILTVKVKAQYEGVASYL